MHNSRLHKYSKIIICLGGMILLSVGTSVFAQGSTPDNSWNFSQSLQQLITLFSWLWVVLAMGAGKLMSNTFVYGEFMNFDVYLWQMRNISKNFANIAIGFMFLFYVRKIIFTPAQLTGSEVGKKIGGFLLAGVLIQASWFMMGALLDIEKIATSAMGALPGLVIQDDNSRGQKMTTAMSNAGVLGKTLELKKQGSNPTYLIYDATQNAAGINTGTESVLDAILPSHNSLSGPLYFIGFAIFQFQSYSTISIDTSLNLRDLSRIVTGTGIKFLVLIAFVLMMLLLFIVNIIRVAYLWMVIALAPIIVLYLVLKDVLGMDMGSAQDGIMSKINFKTILAYIFQPTIIITFMSLILISVTALWQEMGTANTTPIEQYGFTITNTGVSHPTFSLETQGDLFDTIGDTSRGVFQNFIILGLVFALLLGLIILSASSLQISFIENIAKSLGKTLAKVPLIPMRSAGQAGNNILKDTIGLDLASPGNRGKLDIKGENALRELMGLNPTNDSTDDKYLSRLKSSIDNPNSFFSTINSRRDSRKDLGLYITGANATSGLSSSLVNFIDKNHKSTAFQSMGFSDLQSAFPNRDFTQNPFGPDDLDVYIKYKDNARALYNAMMGNKSTNPLPSNVTKDNILRYGFKQTKKTNESTTNTSS